MSFHVRPRAAAAIAACALVLPLAAMAVTPASAEGGLQPPATASSEPPAKATVANGLTLENSFVSAVGWVKPGESYPSRIIVTNPTTTARSGVNVTVSGVDGMSFTDARAVGGGTVTKSATSITWAVGAMPAAVDGKPSIKSLILESKADTLAQDPEIVWKNISSNATMTYTGGPSTPVKTRSHGPKVIPPSEIYDTARYGDRPFPVVPVEYQDRKMADRESAKKLDDAINSPANPGSTWNLFQEMSLGQLFPHGTVPSVGIADAPFGDRTEGFTKLDPQGTCSGVTFGDTPQAIGSPLYANRIKDGIYQMPGTTEYYGRDKYGSGIVGAQLGVGAIFDIDGACGPTAKSVYDAAFIADPEIDYSDYDTDKDGVVDFFMMVFAGCGGNGASQLNPVPGTPATNELCPDGAPDSYDNIWPHSSSLEFTYTDAETGLTGYISDDQLKDLEGRPLWYTNDSRSTMTTDDKGDALKVHVRVGPYNVNPETAIEKASVISHEYGHSLGLPDFYSLGSRDTYGDWNLMATDKSQFMSLFARQEMGWVVPRVLDKNRQIRNMKDGKADTQRIDWMRPDGTPYALTAADGDQGIHNSEAYVAKLPGRQLLKPTDLNKEQGKEVWWSTSGNDFGCVPNGGRNLDISLSQALKGVPAGTKLTAEFDTRFDIEWDYDYGFVMTGKKDGNAVTYTSHASNNGTTTPNATQGNPVGNPNANTCQGTYGNGITGSSGSYADGNPATPATDRVAGNYKPPVWMKDSFDVSDLVGANGGPVEGAVLRFSYATDPGLARPGWFIDNLVIKAGDKVVYSKDFEGGNGDQDDPSVFNGGCKDRLSTASMCTGGWSQLKAGVEAVADHAYYFEMRDRSGFDNDGRGENDRAAIGFEPGLLLEYTDEAHGYGNVGTDNPPAQSPLDSKPEPGSDTPDLNDASFNATAERSTFSDASSKPWIDNYDDPTRTDNDKTAADETEKWVFDYNCLGFKVVRMAGNTTPSNDVPGDLNGDVDVTIGSGCAPFNYGFGTTAPAPAPTLKSVTLKASHTQITAGNKPVLSGVATGTDGKPAANTTVTIVGKKYGQGQTYQTVGTASTNASGVWSLQIAPITQTSYIAQAGGLQSAAQLVRVYARINITAPSTTTSNPVTFRGSMVPAYPGAAVGLAMFDANKKFTYLAQGETDANGNYVITTNMPAGTYNFVVYTSARQGTDKGSKSLRVTVR